MLAERLFEVVKNQPQAVAIHDATKGEITYSKLWQLVQHASHAIEKSAKDEKYIALIADQNADAVIALIATILMGRVVVPIDPRHNKSLAGQMLEPFTQTILSSEERVLPSPFKTIPLQALPSTDESSYDFIAKNTDAYILHTSGTTGKAKPVLVDQSALCHVSEILMQKYHITKKSKVLQFAYLSFDSSMIEIWSTLFGGGTIVIPGQKIRADLYGTLEKILNERAITTATLPSAVVNAIDKRSLFNFETLILAGDEYPVELANRLYEGVPHLINAYGPTESIICATTYEIHEAQSDRVPIGMPLPGMEILIDNPDEKGQGEMLLFSSYLAKGYANDSKKTQDKFGVTKEGRRFYRSGDLGRIKDDGNYEFLGRADNQVKINGQRIELEGIEAQIRNIAQKNDLVVAAISNKMYCLYQSRSKLPVFDTMADKLKKIIPSYAIPHEFLPIKLIPLDFNGKIDRKKLIPVIEQYLDIGKDKAPAKTENTMASLWSEVLEVPLHKLTDDSDFFSSGGDSLSALKLLKAINEKYGINLRLADIISSPPTPQKMMQTVDAQLSGGMS